MPVDAAAPPRAGIPRTLVACSKLMRVERPVGALLLLWPTLAALWMAAGGTPPLDVLTVFVLGTFLARSAGCVANDIADRKIDGHVERTRGRPLATGEVSVRAALVLLAALGVLCLGLALTLNPLTRLLAVVGAAIALAYPFFKRFTHMPQAVLGVAFGWGIPMAFAAVMETVPKAAWLFFAGTFAWIVAYDTLYAMVDRDDDVRVGVKSTAILFGSADRFAVGALQATALALFVWLGVHMGFAHVYFAGLVMAAGMFVHQQVLIRRRQRDACRRAFGNNGWVGFAVFAGTVGEYALAS